MNSDAIVVSVEALKLKLRTPFRIAHGTSTERQNALVRIGDAVGEASLPPYYNTSVEDVKEYVQGINFSFLAHPGGFSLRREIGRLPDGPPAARAAVDMALHHVWASGCQQPLYRMLGLDERIHLASSISQSIPLDLDEWKETLSSISQYPFLKIKLGSGDIQYDEEVVRIAHESFRGRIAVDANSAWSIPDAVNLIPRLAKYELDFIEQPISYEDIDDWHLLRRLLKRPPVPLIADESVRTTDDVIALAGAADGVNLKLAKCGGIHTVLQLISVARALNLRIMLGCMIESSLALTAAAHLATLVDIIDLDAIFHIEDDPFEGVSFSGGYLTLPDGPGLGVSEAPSI